MITRNPLTKTQADALYQAKGFTQNDGFDNATDYIILGAAALYQALRVTYTLILQVSGRSQTGTINISHLAGVAAIDEHAYSLAPPEITGLTFGADINVGNVRLVLTKAAVGENTTLYYRVDQFPVA